MDRGVISELSWVVGLSNVLLCVCVLMGIYWTIWYPWLGAGRWACRGEAISCWRCSSITSSQRRSFGDRDGGGMEVFSVSDWARLSLRCPGVSVAVFRRPVLYFNFVLLVCRFWQRIRLGQRFVNGILTWPGAASDVKISRDVRLGFDRLHGRNLACSWTYT